MFPRGSTLSINSPLWKSSHVWPSPDRSRKRSHKDTSISVIFWTFLFGKLINCVDPQRNMHLTRAFISSSGNNCGNICRYAYHLNKSLQGFVQRKLDNFEINLTLLVIICNCGTYNCHFPFGLCFNRYEYN